MELLIGFLFGIILLKTFGVGTVPVAEAPPSDFKTATTQVVPTGPEADGLNFKKCLEMRNEIGKALSDNQKLVLTLHFVEGLTTSEIGRCCGWSESRVNKLLRSSLALLQPYIDVRNESIQTSLACEFLAEESTKSKAKEFLYYVREFEMEDVAWLVGLSESQVIELYCRISSFLEKGDSFD